MIRVSLISLFIRGGSILSRFALFTFLGKFLSTSDYGVFGLLQSSLAIGVYLIGLDLYVYTNREIPKRDIRGVQAVIQSQFSVHVMAYAAFLLLVLPLLSDRFIPSRYIVWFGALLLFEHGTFEIVRMLIALQRPLLANLLVFLRSILWISAFIVASRLYPGLLTIESLLAFWVSGLFLAFAAGVALLFRVGVLPFESWRVDFGFVRAALKGSSVFLAASVCYKVVEFSNRYFLMYYHSSFEVGIYSFFQNIVNLMDVFIYAAVVMIILPKVIESRSRQELKAYRARLELMYSGILYGTVFMTLALFFAVDPFLRFIGKEELVSNILIFKVLLLSSMFLCLSQIGHYTLYVLNRDRAILLASFAGAVSNVVLNVVLIPEHGLFGAAVSTVTSVVVMGGLKLYLAQRLETLGLGAVIQGPARFVVTHLQRALSWRRPL